MKKILLPTDFSKCAWNAISYALELFRDDICEFYILNTFRPSGNGLQGMLLLEPDDSLYKIKRKDSEDELKKIEQQIISSKGKNPNHEFKFISKFKFVIEAMQFIVDHHDINMVVMGTKGVTDDRTLVYGSHTVKAMEEIRSCPVMAIPNDAEIKYPKEIVLPTDYKLPVKNEKFTPLIEIAKTCDAEIRVLHIIEDENETFDTTQFYTKKLLKEFLSSVKHTFHTIENKNYKKAINCYVESRESDMVVFINKKHSFFSRLLLKPLAENLGYYSAVPVLALQY